MNSLSPLPPHLPPTGPAPAGRADASVPQPDTARVARDFESVLVLKVVEEMAKTVEESSLPEDGAGRQVNDMFYYHLAQELSARGGFGLWKDIARQMGGGALTSGQARPREQDK
jgi:Rod binding domain-containing protein